MRSRGAIEKDLAAQREKVKSLSGVATAARERAGRAETERGAYLVDALTGDGEAQKKLDRATALVDGASRATQDAASAIAQVQAAIVRLNAELAAVEKDGRRQHARNLVEKRAADGREQRIRKMVIELENELEALAASNAEIVEAFHWLDAESWGRARTILSNNQSEPVRLNRGVRGAEPLDRFAASAPQIHSFLLSLLEPGAPAEQSASGESAVAGATAS
jgi:hypothetical protein